MTAESCEVAIVGSGFAGSLLARILAKLGYDVVLLERGSHPRVVVGESSTPLANLGLERIATRYQLPDCYHLATHGRWMQHHPDLRRGLKRGFTFYRHHQGAEFENRGLESERLLVAASPDDTVADTQWYRADVDHHFVKQACAAGVDYRDRAELTAAEVGPDDVRLTGRMHDGSPLELRAQFVIDASGGGGFMARQLAIPSALEQTHTRAAGLAGHFTGVRRIDEVIPGLPAGPYTDDWAAVHHIIEEGWMYTLRFDHGVTSAGFMLSPRGLATLDAQCRTSPDAMWRTLLARYPTIAAAFEGAQPEFPLLFRPVMQHRLSVASGPRWAMLPHAYAFVDPLFSTGIAWGIRAVERLALSFEQARGGLRGPSEAELARYNQLLSAEADQIDRLVAGAYAAMANFELFAAHSMIYFGTVSFEEVRQRLFADESWAWKGMFGLGDSQLEALPRESLARLDAIVGTGRNPTAEQITAYTSWVAGAIAQRNIAGVANASRHNLYPVDLDTLIDNHALMGLTREELVAALPALRGRAPEPEWTSSHLAIGPTIASEISAGAAANATGMGT